MMLMGALRDNSSHVVFSLACFFICSDFQTTFCGAPGVPQGCPGDVWEWQKKSTEGGAAVSPLSHPELLAFNCCMYWTSVIFPLGEKKKV